MKGLASVLLGIVLMGVVASAGPLELGFGTGPSFTSLASVNDSIDVLNRLIEQLNDTSDVHPDLDGVVDPMPSIGRGLFMSAGEQYRLVDWLALGIHVGYVGSSSATAGSYTAGTVVSEFGLSYRAHVLSAVLGGEVTFVDMGLRLAATAGVGYFHTILHRNITFQIPAEFPEVIAGLPSQGAGRYTGGTFGLEAGITLAYPIFNWLTIGTRVSYRSATVASLSTAQGSRLDLNGDGQNDPLSLNGFTVQFMFSINIDLSPDGGKESLQ